MLVVASIIHDLNDVVTFLNLYPDDPTHFDPVIMQRPLPGK